jgi:hypothetical protein
MDRHCVVFEIENEHLNIIYEDVRHRNINASRYIEFVSHYQITRAYCGGCRKN